MRGLAIENQAKFGREAEDSLRAAMVLTVAIRSQAFALEDEEKSKALVTTVDAVRRVLCLALGVAATMAEVAEEALERSALDDVL